MRVPRLDPEQSTFSLELYERFQSRYGSQRCENILQALSVPVKNFAIRATLVNVSRESIIEELESQGWKSQGHPIMGEMLTVQTKGPFSIPYLQAKERIIADKIAAESVFTGSDLFNVGVKRIPKLEIGDEVSILSDENQIVATGISKINSRDIYTSGIAIETTNSFFRVPSMRKLGYIESGNAYSQSIPAAYVAHVLNPQQEDKIVDLCAAPGGKTTSAAILAKNNAQIIAFDRSNKRIQKLRNTIVKQHLKNIEVINASSIEYLKTHTIKADKVIVDPSCSATGVRPKIYVNTSYKEIMNASNYQKPFLWVANKIVREGGIITYSTCSLEPEENEENIAYAVNELGLKLIDPEIEMGTMGEETNQGLTLEYMRRFYPDLHDTPGFFVAKLKK